MRRLAEISLISMLFAALAAPATAQQPPATDVGVIEQLGRPVPLDLAFVDEAGQAITLKDLVDKPTVLTLNYFRCAGLCTPLLNGMVDVLNEIRLEPGKDFRVITVSFDERDAPEVARKKRDNLLKQLTRPFPPAAWHLLTGKNQAIAALTEATGFRFRADGTEFIHAGVIVILSPAGVVTRYLYGTHFPAADLELAIREAAKGEARPTIAKTLEFCYVYDPASRERVFRLTRLAGAATLAILLIFVGLLIRRGRKPGR